MNAVLRRTKKGAKSAALRSGPIELVADEMRVFFNGKNFILSRNEFLLLKHFMENVGKVLSRDDIITVVWGEDCYIVVDFLFTIR